MDRSESRLTNGPTVRGKVSQRFKVKKSLTPLWIAVELMAQNGSEYDECNN
jgi:hypothetical protein